MSLLIGIDPGPRHSAVVVYNSLSIFYPDVLPRHVRIFNAMLKPLLCEITDERFVEAIGIEAMASYGLPVGEEVLTTCMWIGRLVEMLETMDMPPYLFPRQTILSCLDVSRTGKGKAYKSTDANVRHSILTMYGGAKDGLGTKEQPGPLYGLAADEWSAFAVALTLEQKLIDEAAKEEKR